MRVTTWNVNSLRARLDHVVRFVAEAKPDVLCLQELKLPQDQFPVDVLGPLFPHSVWWGQPTYNGVAILSKLPLSDVRKGFAVDDDGEARVLTCVVDGVRLYGLYCPNGTELGSARFHAKLRWYDRLADEVAAYAADAEVLVVGDMNVAPDDLDVWDPFKCDGQLLCHPDERAAFARLCARGRLTDAFREREPFANAFTWWHYQKMGFQRNHGLRIDHALASAPLMARLRAITIHRGVRGWDQPSDHAPVSADFADRG